MVDSNRWFQGNKDVSGFDMSNVADFKRWIEDNKSKTNEGLEALQAVMSIGTDVASAACVKRFRDKGKEQTEVAALTSEICDKIIAACNENKSEVVKDCASLFAGTGNTALVMMMGFVCYSIIGINVADELMDEV
jgi:hypothetical protein